MKSKCVLLLLLTMFLVGCSTAEPKTPEKPFCSGEHELPFIKSDGTAICVQL